MLGLGVDVMRQSACLVVNPITVNNFSVLFAHRGSTGGLLLLQCFSGVADAHGISKCRNTL